MDLLFDKTYFANVRERLTRKIPYSIKKANEIQGIPYTTKDGKWVSWHVNWWTNGFYPALMWLMYMDTHDEMYRIEAVRTEEILDEALKNFKDIDHDAGFMWLISSGVRHALEGNSDSLDRTLFAADMLAARLNPNGFIRAWNGKGKEGIAIIDCMMNLPLLYHAEKLTGDPRYGLIAMVHADTAKREFVRPDHSCNHIVEFDPVNGEVMDTPAGQGYASGSCWTRGEAWAIYGFLLSYLYTGRKEYLDISRGCADYFLLHLPKNNIPPCDFKQPEDSDIVDCAAAVIAASGLIELAKVTEEDGQKYITAAEDILKAVTELYADFSEDNPAIIGYCTAAWSDVAQHHINMIYADYFYTEAVLKLCGMNSLLWKPDTLV